MQTKPNKLTFWHPPRTLNHTLEVTFAACFLWVLLVLVPSTADGQQFFTIPANALENDAPGVVSIIAKRGDLVSVDPSAVLNARTEWVIPDDFKQFQVDGQSKCVYIAVPDHTLEFMLVIAPNDLDKRLQIRRFRISGGGHPDPDDDDAEPTPDPTPDPPDPTPEPPEDYTGPNEYGIGKVAYDAAQGVSGDRLRMAIGILETGRDNLQGIDGGVLFIDSPNKDRNVFDWMTLSSSDWFDPVVSEMEKLKSPKMRLADWIKVFNEAIAGIKEALK